MKFIPSQILYLIQDRRAQRNLGSLVKFIVFLLFFITLYSFLFHVLMEREGQEFSWITGFYWTLTVMSTLGFGDITFATDLGRIFSLVVLLSGIVFLLVMLPFTFIQFFYAPFLDAQSKSRAVRAMPENASGHLIIVGADPVALALASRLGQFNFDYCILVPDVHHALDLMDQGYKAVVGDSDDSETYARLRTNKAAMVVVLSDDMKNTNAAYTIREVAPDVTIVANADSGESVDILQLAGASHVYQFMRMLGEMLARRTLATGTRSNVIGSFDELRLAEAPAQGTPLVGRTIRDCGLRDATGMNIVGLWERGRIETPRPDTVITPNSVFVLAGTQEQLDAFDRFAGPPPPVAAPVLILGGGRVGRAAAQTLSQQGVEYRIVEKNPKLVGDGDHFVHGSASDLDVLVAAGINEAPSVFVTTHNDDLNIYLTIYCRRLRPDIQIISRATLDRNINVLHKAGANLVMSYSTIAANTVINLLSPGKVLTLTEGLNIFRVRVHSSLAGKSLMNSQLRQDTGCSVIAVVRGEKLEVNPDPHAPLDDADSLLVIGDATAERLFMESYPG
ncbi:MAG: NAD-binding protein [Pseudodesulfovibrio sp.]|uniref:TrkA-C domain protein n=1 Tax=Pseudodesulfovibrio aespoeensis (strain ATCC 700646 / DSM 10631 / Aspo-2) TaxID=643562 RepID=E6VYQ4_PSEA9|nr:MULTISPECIES: NAD-binding protein [Pseudodesulfovibrio]MBU4190795.1 NAD-binding protein [Pseudomonadota bacterium]ADU63921.1 TrkA-C domain protein [Pseudodesulfovibrio aespoeensis Aspo-2]MBU4244185.1 NAD-binding protein [Pseudomonadota bacterium]MBU4377668.1 NAD-binding protein [Pseudomonadota bacterium]MBU4475412.1 NAD-binding protein [Pseudomonadota bacterium]